MLYVSVCVCDNQPSWFAQNWEGVSGFGTLNGNSGKVPVPTRTNWSLSRVGRCRAVCVNADSDLYGVLLIVFNSDSWSEDENEII